MWGSPARRRTAVAVPCTIAQSRLTLRCMLLSAASRAALDEAGSGLRLVSHRLTSPQVGFTSDKSADAAHPPVGPSHITPRVFRHAWRLQMVVLAAPSEHVCECRLC